MNDFAPLLRQLQLQNDPLAISAAEAIRSLIKVRDEMAATGARDSARLDWLADRDNAIGQVLLPTECVTAHLDMRAAIDAAMAMAEGD